MIYEPTNITPSTLNQTGTIASSEDVDIRWQVNGNSALSMFQIDIYENTASSELTYSTGVISSPAGQGSTLPFNGKDRLGEYIPFVYTPNSTWGSWGIQDGNEYKFSITQFYATPSTSFRYVLNETLSAGNTYYYICSGTGITTQYISFSVAAETATFFATGNILYFDVITRTGWVRQTNNNSRIETNLTFSVTTTVPDSATSLGAATIIGTADTFYNMAFTSQNGMSAIIARTLPALAINEITTPINSASADFSATYTQAQGDAISTVRWQLFNADNPTIAIDDTSAINTSVLEYEYNGLFNNQQYTLVCTVVTANNVTVTSSADFSVSYAQQTYTGDFNVLSVCSENSNLLQWDPIMQIPGEGDSSQYSISDGQLHLNEDATISWSNIYDENNEAQPLNFNSPWTMVWKGEISVPSTNYLYNLEIAKAYSNLRCAAFSTDGTLLAIAGGEEYNGYVDVFTVSGTSVSRIAKLGDDGYPVFYRMNAAAISPDKTLIVVGGENNDYGGFIYSINGQSISYVSTLPQTQGVPVKTIAFSPSGNILVYGTSEGVYRGIVNNGNISSVTEITRSGDSLTGAQTVEFNPSGNLLVIGGSFTGSAAIFSVNGTTVSYVSDMTFDPDFWGTINAINFAPSGTSLVLCADDPHMFATIYSVSGTNITYVANITKNDTTLIGEAYSASFSPDGKRLAIGGLFMEGGSQSGSAMLFSVDGTTVTYLNDIIDDSASLSDIIYAITYNPKQGMLVAGGYNYNAMVYDSTNSVLTSLYEIPGDLEAITSLITATALSPDGSLLVLAGGFSSRTAIYRVSGNIISYISTLSSDIMDGLVSDLCFSPDGSKLFVCGSFSSKACIYSVNGSTFTFDSNITIPSDILEISTIAINPSGTLLVLAGNNYAAAYSISNVGATFLTNLTVNSAEIDGHVFASAFRPDGNVLVLGGSFNNYHIVYYSVSGSTFTYSGIVNDGNAEQVDAIAFSADGKRLVFGGRTSEYDGFARWCYSSLLDSAGSAGTFVIDGITDSIYAIKYISDNYCFIGRHLYSFDANSATFVFNLDTSNNWDDTRINTFAYNSSSKLLFAGGEFSGYAATWSVNIAEQENGNFCYAYYNKTGTDLARIAVEMQYPVIALTTTEQQGSTFTHVGIGSASILDGADTIVIAVTPTQMNVYSFDGNTYIGMETSNLISDFQQSAMTKLELLGPQTCDYIAVCDGNGAGLLSNLSTPGFVPSWNDPEYTLELRANFVYGIDGGTGTSSGNGFRIYRRNISGTENKEIATLNSQIYQLKDFSVKSGEQYIYDFYVYDADGAFMGVRSTEDSPICQRFSGFSLIATQYNETDYCYHVVKEYMFSCNIQDMSISNNNSPTFVQNFTPYPTRFNSTANYASGTLQALIGFVDYTAYKYWDSTKLMSELNSLSTEQYTLFLRDMKGHLWMVAIGGAIQQTVTQKTREMQVTISLPWTEIGDASDVSIIQTPEDEGWNYDTQVLDVKFDVDIDTGVLRVIYPYPYNGTAFYLIGVTPDGVTATVQALPSVANNPTDGQITAVVRHK